jgi:NAD-dependent deacetylase sirtuin 4
MRISIPTIPYAAKPTIPNVTLPEAIKRLTDFLRSGATTVLTGAGVSVDSGIKAYRGHDGRYMNRNFQSVAQSYHHIERVD